MKKIQAVNNHVIVEVDVEGERKSEGGLHLPGSVTIEPQKYGTVTSIGPDVNYSISAKKYTGTLKVGDKIAFSKHGGQDIYLNGKLVKILKDNEVYGIMTEE
jgi:co-chaperonin GroES (HSP10)